MCDMMDVTQPVALILLLPRHRRRILATLYSKPMRTPILLLFSYRRRFSYVSFSHARVYAFGEVGKGKTYSGAEKIWRMMSVFRGASRTITLRLSVVEEYMAPRPA
jgi:hypothetical protein